jgi:hypothetical protein
MLAYALAIAVGLSSLFLLLAAFFYSDLHRKDDFLWSGVGLFYALVLWSCAGRFTGAVLLGQVAGVALILAFEWENIRLRKAIARPNEAFELKGSSVVGWLQNRLGFGTKPKSKLETPPIEPIVSPEVAENVSEAIAETTTAVIESTIDDSVVVAEESVTPVVEDTVEKIEDSLQEKVETEIAEVQETVSIDSVIQDNTILEKDDDEIEEDDDDLFSPSITNTTKVTPKQGFSFTRLMGQITNPFRKKKVESMPTSPLVTPPLEETISLTETVTEETSLEETLAPVETIAEESPIEETIAVTEPIIEENPLEETLAPVETIAEESPIEETIAVSEVLLEEESIEISVLVDEVEIKEEKIDNQKTEEIKSTLQEIETLFEEKEIKTSEDKQIQTNLEELKADVENTSESKPEV